MMPIANERRLGGMMPVINGNDTGATLQLVHKVIDDQVGEARCAVLYQKPRSVIDCEYVFRRTDLWINFPWLTEAPVCSPEESPLRRQAQRV